MSSVLVVSSLFPAFGAVMAAASAVGPSTTDRVGRLSGIAPFVYAGVLGVGVLAAGLSVGFDAASFGVTAGDGWARLAVAIGIGIVLAPVLFLAELALAQVWSPSTARRPGRRVSTPAPAVAAVQRTAGMPGRFAALAVWTAVVEELLFRGYLLRDLVDSWPVLPAVVVQAVLFGALHASFGARNVVAKGAAGAIWGVLALWSGSVVPSMASHLLFQLYVYRRLARQAVPA